MHWRCTVNKAKVNISTSPGSRRPEILYCHWNAMGLETLIRKINRFFLIFGYLVPGLRSRWVSRWFRLRLSGVDYHADSDSDSGIDSHFPLLPMTSQSLSQTHNTAPSSGSPPERKKIKGFAPLVLGKRPIPLKNNEAFLTLLIWEDLARYERAHF